MSKMGALNLSLTNDDMGEPAYNPDDFVNHNELRADALIEQAQREWELTKYTTEELNKELERRGYINGVLVYPEKEPSLIHDVVPASETIK